MSTKYRYPVGKKVYYFRDPKQGILSGTIYKHNTMLFGEIYFLTPDNPTKAETNEHERNKKFRKKMFDEDWNGPVVTHMADVSFIKEHTKTGLKSLKNKICLWYRENYSRDKQDFINKTEAYKKAIRKIKEIKCLENT